VNTVPFDCDTCEGTVDMVTATGRYHEVRRNIYVKVPDDFPLATCDKCGGVYLTSGESEQLEQIAGDLVEVVRCADCRHGEPDEMGDGSPGICCDVWFYHDKCGGREKCWPINALDHFCAKGERKA
jgi:hypothetical protein